MLPDNLAYLIYTSGSTGRPKGVAGSHRQILSYLAGIRENIEMNPGATFAMHQSLTVDAPITFLFGSLLTGGLLHILAAEQASDADALAAYFAQHPIDNFKVAPSHYAALLAAASSPAAILPRRLLMIGGEAAGWEWAHRLQEAASGCVILNHYGPTETTCGVMTYRVGETCPERPPATLPLGRPLANTRIHLLDVDLGLVPVGVPAEIHIAGSGVARGYLGRPDLTAEKFVPDPWGEPGGRLYKTGDLARRLPDGGVEFLGRTDHQVKVRGFRIELEEIEAVLGWHPAVIGAAVLARPERQGDHHLVACVLPRDGEMPSAAELRGFLAQSLPDHMLPSSFVLLGELPRTPQGKIDRRALATAPETAAVLSGAGAGIPPRNRDEEILAGLWCEVLGLAEVGVHDDFFELGGHSLRATQLISRVRSAFAVELPLRALFENPTIAATAAAVAQTRQQSTEAPRAPEIRPAARETYRATRAALRERTAVGRSKEDQQ